MATFASSPVIISSTREISNVCLDMLSQDVRLAGMDVDQIRFFTYAVESTRQLIAEDYGVDLEEYIVFRYSCSVCPPPALLLRKKRVPQLPSCHLQREMFIQLALGYSKIKQAPKHGKHTMIQVTEFARGQHAVLRNVSVNDLTEKDGLLSNTRRNKTTMHMAEQLDEEERIERQKVQKAQREKEERAATQQKKQGATTATTRRQSKKKARSQEKDQRKKKAAAASSISSIIASLCSCNKCRASQSEGKSECASGESEGRVGEASEAGESRESREAREARKAREPSDLSVEEMAQRVRESGLINSKMPLTCDHTNMIYQSNAIAYLEQIAIMYTMKPTERREVFVLFMGELLLWKTRDVTDFTIRELTAASIAGSMTIWEVLCSGIYEDSWPVEMDMMFIAMYMAKIMRIIYMSCLKRHGTMIQEIPFLFTRSEWDTTLESVDHISFATKERMPATLLNYFNERNENLRMRALSLICMPTCESDGLNHTTGRRPCTIRGRTERYTPKAIIEVIAENFMSLGTECVGGGNGYTHVVGLSEFHLNVVG